jgi:hypothetical protein
VKGKGVQVLGQTKRVCCRKETSADYTMDCVNVVAHEIAAKACAKQMLDCRYSIISKRVAMERFTGPVIPLAFVARLSFWLKLRHRYLAEMDGQAVRWFVFLLVLAFIVQLDSTGTFFCGLCIVENVLM